MGSSAVEPISTGDLWSKFETTRKAAPTLHQEFAVTQRLKNGFLEEVSHYKIIVDLSEGKWREQSVGRAGDLTRIYDTENLLEVETDGTEYTRSKHKNDKEKDELLPDPYATKPDWGKAHEVQRGPCGFAGKDHLCIVLDAPIKPWLRPMEAGHEQKMINGTIRFMVDTETGMWLRTQTTELIEGGRYPFERGLIYTISGLRFGVAPDEALFKLPAGDLHEVSYLTPWDDVRIKKQLAGKPAPEMQVRDIHGNMISLASLKGKTVLLDFWTTWCPPCQSDASSVEKLSEKYGKDLAVVGISVSEDRDTVEPYLKKHPHNFPIVLSSENLMPRPYQIGVFPTYLVISPDGTLTTAEEGDQGFAKLRQDLKKAGLAIE